MATLFFDNDADMRIGRWLAQRGHSITSAGLTHLERTTDREILLHAGPAGLILVTHNERHFVQLHRARMMDHAGILALPQILPGEIASIGETVHWLVSSSQPMANELYRFRRSGWQRWLGPDQWIAI